MVNQNGKAKKNHLLRKLWQVLKTSSKTFGKTELRLLNKGLEFALPSSATALEDAEVCFLVANLPSSREVSTTSYLSTAALLRDSGSRGGCEQNPLLAR